MKVYGRLIFGILVLGLLVFLEKLFTGPLAFVTGLADATFTQWIQAALGLVLTLFAIRFVRREVVHGWLERRSGKQVPELLADMISGLVFFVGFCLIVAFVFKRDVSALVATGGASAVVVGIAAKDIIMALFTGILLNVEKPFKVGDLVKINDKHEGKVVRTTWRTTVLETRDQETIILPNVSLSTAVIMNYAMPDTRVKRKIEVVIDYDTSVESAERILYAAALGATGFKQAGTPTVMARRMERDGVVYEVGYVLAHYDDYKRSDHAIIRSVLKCMRDAEITVSFPKMEMIRSERRVAIANRALDVFHLVQQCRVFRGLSDDTCHRIADALIEHHFAAGATIVSAGERRHSIFIVGEGMAKRTLTDREGAKLVQERFIATESFGRRALFACQEHAATVQAETAVLAYELDRRSLAKLLQESPDLLPALSQALAALSWSESNRGRPASEAPPAVIERLVHVYRGQIELNYLKPAEAKAKEAVAISV